METVVSAAANDENGYRDVKASISILHLVHLPSSGEMKYSEGNLFIYLPSEIKQTMKIRQSSR